VTLESTLKIELGSASGSSLINTGIINLFRNTARSSLINNGVVNPFSNTGDDVESSLKIILEL
jgi:hypothetical protein